MSEDVSIVVSDGREPGVRQDRGFVRGLVSLPATALLGVIAAYQRFLSPVLPALTLGQCACRFTPTCSHYAAQAVREHGALVGAWLALRRLVKCTPLHPGGIDPVPARRVPVCRPTSSLFPTPSP